MNENGKLLYEVSKILDEIPDRYKEYGKGGIYKDKYQSQLEIATDVCEDLDELEEQLDELRKVVNDAAEETDLFLMAIGANPFTKGKVGEYFAEQHHIDARTNEEKLKMNNFLRIFVPEIFALSSNSPIHDNQITKWKSVRASMDTYDPSKRVNPNIKPAPYLSMGDIERGYLQDFENEDTFEKKRKKSRYYDVSPFTQKDRVTDEYKPTLEVRLLDTHPYIPLTIAYGALFQALAKKMEKINHIPDLSIEYNRNNSIKNGISSKFLIKRDMKRYFHYRDLSDKSSVEVIKSLLDWIDPELKELGYKKKIKPLKRFLKYKRNIADWQIRLLSKERDQFVSEMLKASMEDYDKQPLPEQKIKFKFVEQEEGRKEKEWDEIIEESYEKLRKRIERSYTINFRKYANSLLALKECNPMMKEKKCKDLVDTLIKKYSGSNFYYSVLFLETLFTYEETEREIYKRNAKEIVEKVREGVLEEKQLWLSAYVISVISRIGGGELDKQKHAEKIHDKISEDTPLWVRGYVTEGLTISSFDGSKELSKLKRSLKEDHWECEQLDDLSATSIIYNCLNNIGYNKDKVVEWLKRELEKETKKGLDDILKTSFALRALSEEAIK